ncbi:hypothetical protein ACFL0Y_00835 [Patescibacteria group bacterium]
MFRKFIKISIIFLALFWLVRPTVIAQEKKPIYFFWSKTCSHCSREKDFLIDLVQKYPQLEIRDFEVSASQENLKLLQKVGKELSAKGGVPFTVVGKYHFVGYLDDETTGKEIEEAVNCYLEEGCRDVVAGLINGSEPEETSNRAIPETLSLPLIGNMETKNLSLPVLTFIIALLDGFNPCAMWALLFLISLLLGMKDKKRMWLLGTTFIVASGVVYFLFMTAWLNLFLFLGFVLWVRLLIGLVALAAGGWSLRDYWVNRDGSCKTVGDKKKEKIFNKIRQMTQRKELWLALGGIILLAFAVNLIELVCSAGLPAIYTQILSLTELPRWQYYGYLLFYILIFMLDDLFVFFIAMITLRATGIQNKYARWSRLIGGALMVVIGLLLLFKPEWLMFA